MFRIFQFVNLQLSFCYCKMPQKPNLTQQGLIFSFLCLFIIVCEGFIDIATVNITFSGTDFSCTSNCNTTQQVNELACNNDPTSWQNGVKQFFDPIPKGYRAESINTTLYLNIGCTNYSQSDGVVTIDNSIVGFLPSIEGK